MKMYNIVFILLLLSIVVSDVFFYFKLKNKNTKALFVFLHLIPAIFFSVLFFYIKFGLENSKNFRVVAEIMWLYFFFLLIYIPKIIHITFYFLHYIYQKIYHRSNKYFNIFRVVVTIFAVITMLLSAYVTSRRFELSKTTISIPNLPESFNGYKIIQISDLHLGSWNNKYNKLKPIIKIINNQKPDLIVFTGDIVNNFASETEGWQCYFLELDTKSAKFAVLGNHDYGDYCTWDNTEDKINNQLKINKAIKGFGFNLLLNENASIKKGNDSIVIVGVENWGKTIETRYSDLTKALIGTDSKSLKILLTHDPNHFDAEIRNKKDIFLTLSGHTHAAQLGFKIGNKLFSPAAFIFKYWSGLYHIENQYLYVNRGLGYIGLPMHIGVRPEITLIELRKSK